METMTATSVKLNDRTLWFDGDSTVSENQLIPLITKLGSANGLFVEFLSDSIKQYNKYAEPDQQIKVKQSVGEPNLSWNLPEEYTTLNVKEHVLDKMWDELEDHGWIGDGMMPPGVKRIMRTKHELELYAEMGLTDVIRTLIYIINTLQSRNVVWGVGRGSSVASYVLYLIGVHDVDSVEYDLDITEFLRPNDA